VGQDQINSSGFPTGKQIVRGNRLLWKNPSTRAKNLEGRVTEVVKGGLLVDVGMRGFVPASQIDEQYVEDLRPYIGQTFIFKVIQHDLPNGKLILSRKALLNEAKAGRRRETLAVLSEGQRLQGVVKRIMEYGVFVDIGGNRGAVAYIRDVLEKN
jgi:ribosomal protein S1